MTRYYYAHFVLREPDIWEPHEYREDLFGSDRENLGRPGGNWTMVIEHEDWFVGLLGETFLFEWKAEE